MPWVKIGKLPEAVSIVEWPPWEGRWWISSLSCLEFVILMAHHREMPKKEWKSRWRALETGWDLPVEVEKVGKQFLGSEEESIIGTAKVYKKKQLRSSQRCTEKWKRVEVAIFEVIGDIWEPTSTIVMSVKVPRLKVRNWVLTPLAIHLTRKGRGRLGQERCMDSQEIYA